MVVLQMYRWLLIVNGIFVPVEFRQLEIGQFSVAPLKTLSVAPLKTLSQTSPSFYVSAVQVFRKHCGKMRNFW